MSAMQRLEIGEKTSSQGEPDALADKRFYIRFRKENKVRISQGEEWLDGVLIDISMMGVSLFSGRDWPIGSRLKIMSQLFSCQLDAEIIRKDELRTGNRYALVFHDLSDSAIIEILNKIAKFRE
ncbi:type IV pilus assembly protein PilZ [Leptospira inadai serovar Lyme str. 10]|uniref:Type IV pilus assembly protein PilZ n=2 Tax=Leptospira inadai serovar Lyme TaxID=293084 RepID=V6HQQ0_9LEPT|nr:type IV pilus assembly protein PilZ [Leptospira inadai serovar Lyme str. 10]